MIKEKRRYEIYRNWTKREGMAYFHTNRKNKRKAEEGRVEYERDKKYIEMWKSFRFVFWAAKSFDCKELVRRFTWTPTVLIGNNVEKSWASSLIRFSCCCSCSDVLFFSLVISVWGYKQHKNQAHVAWLHFLEYTSTKPISLHIKFNHNVLWVQMFHFMNSNKSRRLLGW